MAEWTRHAFGGEEEGAAIESLLEFCGVFPFSGLPDALGKRCVIEIDCLTDVGWKVGDLTLTSVPPLDSNHRRVEAHVEKLMGEGKEREALAVIKRCLQAPWAEDQKVWCVELCLYRSMGELHTHKRPSHPPTVP